MITVATKLDAPIKFVYSTGSKVNMLGLGDIVIPGLVISLALRFDLWRHYQKQIKYVPVELKSDFGDEASDQITTLSKRQYIAKKKEFRDLTGAWADRFWLLGRPRVVDSRQFAKPYFYASLIGYTLGMLATVFFLLFFKHGQPALLYLVPGVLGSLLVTGWARGELKEMWNYTEDGSLDTEDTIVQLDAEGRVIPEPPKEENKKGVDEKKDEKSEKEKTVVEDSKDTAEQKDSKGSQNSKKGKKSSESREIFVFSISSPESSKEELGSFEFENLHSE
jgi:minor histocompatibility antigen H13